MRDWNEGTKLGLSDGEIMCTTLVSADRFKLGSKEVSYLGFSNSSFEVFKDGKPECSVLEDEYTLEII